MALLAFIERVDTWFIATGCSWRPFFGTQLCSADLRWLLLPRKRGPNGSSTVKDYLALNFAAI